MVLIQKVPPIFPASVASAKGSQLIVRGWARCSAHDGKGHDCTTSRHVSTQGAGPSTINGMWSA